MIYRKLWLLSALAAIQVYNPAQAQDAGDALRYSYLSPTGTARSMGFGSTLGSIGGDFTSLSVNPAGIGIYRKSEVMFTPSLKVNSATGNYLNDSYDESNTKFNFNNIGIVFTSAARGKNYDKAAWKAVSFGIGVNRLADFNRNYTYGGLMKGSGNNYSSFAEVFAEDANIDPQGAQDASASTLGYLGYQSYLTNIDPLTGSFYAVPNWETGLSQLKTVEERGGINELLFSLGGNYKEKLMLGATVGVPFVRYTRDIVYSEVDASGNQNNDFESFQYNNNLVTSGAGINIKLGAIFKPVDNFRLGVALHTPTWYAMSDVENREITGRTEAAGGSTTIFGAEQNFSYNLATPWKGILSATALIGKVGFITADYEYVDYSASRFGFSNQFRLDESIRNQSIKNLYQSASNVRVGGEVRLDAFAIRAGYGYYGNPYEDKNKGFTRNDFSVGFGLRSERMFIDIGFTHSRFESKEQPYLLSDPVVVPTATIENRMNNAALTVGFKM